MLRIILAICLLAVFIMMLNNKVPSTISVEKKEEIWEPRSKYLKDDVLFAVSPDPSLHSAKSFGYMFNFSAPFETFHGKKLGITAYHKDTGEKITVFSPELITEPSSGYHTLDRFIAFFFLPLDGLWKLEVTLDNEYYGDVIVSVQKPPSEFWQKSSLFQSGSYTMLGQEGRLGFIYDDHEVARFYPNKFQKYMWHFWGDKKELEGKFQVFGVKQDSNERIKVFETSWLGGPHNGADAHTPSGMSLPSSGLWRLDAYIGENYFGSVVVEVHEQE